MRIFSNRARSRAMEVSRTSRGVATGCQGVVRLGTRHEEVSLAWNRLDLSSATGSRGGKEERREP